jgi:hypothetical protein
MKLGLVSLGVGGRIIGTMELPVHDPGKFLISPTALLSPLSS